MLGVITAVAGDPPEGERILARALERFEVANDVWGMAFERYTLGRVLLLQDRGDDALETLRLSVAGARATGEKLLLSFALLNLGWAQLGLGDRAGATASLQEAFEILARFRNVEAARVLEALAAAAAALGDPPRGALLFGAAEGLRRALGAGPGPPRADPPGAAPGAR
jgi:tetratricopeptide (TPR) repeat protein